MNFWLTNRIPRRTASRLARWFSRVEQPLVRDLSMAVWQRLGGDLRLEEATAASFRSVHECFVRRLRPGARPIDPRPNVIASPCDGIVGASGTLRGTEAMQIKGSRYAIDDLLCSPNLVRQYANGRYVTLRLTSVMYHHFHAPFDVRVREVSYFPGDLWNVNRAALQRVERLYCRNERAVIAMTLDGSHESLAMVPVAAILVGGLRLEFLRVGFDSSCRVPQRLGCDVPLAKGAHMGHFEHGSTIVILATSGLRLWDGLVEGMTVRMGQPLLHRA